MIKQYYPDLDEQVYRDRLPGGLSVAVVPKKGVREKVAYFATSWGAIHTAYTLDGRKHTAPPGTAHYLEHKLFDMPGGRDVSAEFAALGANVNAFTDYDMTAFHFSCTENFEACLKLLLEFVSTAYFTAESVEREQGIIAQEIDMTADTPESRVYEKLVEAMYAVHPVRFPILGTRQTIRDITPQLLEDCHRAFFHPSSMILCVVGDVEPEAVRDTALQVLPQEPEAPAQRIRYWQEPMTTLLPETRMAMDVAMPMFHMGFKCEPAPKGEPAARQKIVGYLATEMLLGEASPLYLRLYEQGLIDYAFGGGFETMDGMAMLTAFGDSDDPHAVREAILEQAQILCQTPLEPGELARTKRSALGRRIRDLDSFDSTCFRLCAYHFDGFDYFRFPALYEAVTEAEIRQFLSRTVTRERCCLSVITPIEEE